MGIVLLRGLFSIFPLASTWGHGGLWSIKGSFQHCRRSDTQETLGCLHVTDLCPQALQCLWEKAE